MNFLEIENIVKSYENHRALDDVSITVKKGRIFGLLGPNGAGKTSLIRIITQITAPDNGIIKLNGERMTMNNVGNIGYLPEERGLYKKMKVGEQALYLAQLKGMSKKLAHERLKNWFYKFEITGWWNKKVEELSKGMQQKIQFIITVLHEPELLIFDEPFSGFDPINANLLKNEILELRNRGATIIFSTHNMSSVEEICDDIALINNSKVILDGDIHEIKNRFKTNTYEVRFQGDFDKIVAAQTPDYSINEISNKNGSTLVNLTLSDGVSTNKMLQHIIQAGNICEFSELIPSMNDIFINVVENTNAQKEVEIA
ncbi:MAG: ATP-binding cassette domain-containing protein [Bacteroidales bacterium]|nr:ATP-binding cassette domain-containing protein [Bacteroidales bacterium]